MTRKRSFSTALAATVAVGIGGMWLLVPRGQAQDQSSNQFNNNQLSNQEERRILKGFEIAPVTLNLAGKNMALVGLGSYIVNAQGDCNGCHSAGPPTQYTPNGSPYPSNVTV